MSTPAVPPLHALKNIMALIDDGTLVRNISRDGEEGWHLRMLSLVKTLAEAQAAIDNAKKERSGQ